VSPDYGPAYAFWEFFCSSAVINGFPRTPNATAPKRWIGGAGLQLDPSMRRYSRTPVSCSSINRRTERAIGVLRRCVEIAELTSSPGVTWLSPRLDGGEKEWMRHNPSAIA